MDAVNNGWLLADIISASLGTRDIGALPCGGIDADTPRRLSSVARRHDLSHLLHGGLSAAGVELDAETSSALQQEELVSVLRYKNIEHDYAQICGILSEAHIPFVPLKGSVIRAYYPRPSMRTSCDIDILIHESDLDAASASLVSAGYRQGVREFHDVSLYSPAGVHLELHFSLKEAVDGIDPVLDTVWDYVEPTSSGSMCEMRRDFFLFHIIAHMSYHFVSGGSGLRSLLDLYIIGRGMHVSPADARHLLEPAGIYTFALRMFELAEACFGTGERNGDMELILSYILSGGTYGLISNKAAMKRSEGKGTFSYILSRLFPSYEIMSQRYPRLRRVPVLLPFYWVVRFFAMLRKGEAKRSLNDAMTNKNVKAEDIDRAQKIRDLLAI